jgi:DNA-directed RNA polymerase specialized sigma24 family protein
LKAMPHETTVGTPATGTGARFNTTHWSVVLTAGGVATEASRQALETLCRTYWFPLYAYLRHKGQSPHDAQDLTQAFLASLLARDSLQSVAQEKGRFRTFLLAALNHFLSDERDKASAQKRGGGMALLWLDEQAAEQRYATQLLDDASPDQLYDYHWALSLLDRAYARLKTEHGDKGRAFELLQPFLTDKPADQSYENAARELGMTNGAVRVAVTRLRKRFRELVTEEVQQAVANPEDAPAELRLLLGHFGRR